MKFTIKAVQHDDPEVEKDQAIARKVSDALLKELNGFVKVVVFFGSATKPSKEEKGDLDLLLIFDDLPDRMNPEIIRSYLLIASKISKKFSKKIHLTHMPLTEFWDYVRKGDPIAINIIREGIPLYDPGFFQPVKALLRRGKIKPSQESVFIYAGRASGSLQSANWHMLQAVLDLYWAVIDAAHAALMKAGHVPVSPDHVAQLIDKEFVAKGLLHGSFADTMNRFFALQDMVQKRQLKDMPGAEFESYYKQADAFIAGMKTIIEGK